MAEFTTGATVLLFGAVFTVVGIVFAPLLCLGIPLLLVGAILVLAEQSKQPPAAPYTGYAPPFPVGPAPTAPLPAPSPPETITSAEPATPTRSCPNCGSSLTPAAKFCSNCGAPVQG